METDSNNLLLVVLVLGLIALFLGTAAVYAFLMEERIIRDESGWRFWKCLAMDLLGIKYKHKR